MMSVSRGGFGPKQPNKILNPKPRRVPPARMPRIVRVKCPACGFAQALRRSDWLCLRCANILCVSMFKEVK